MQEKRAKVRALMRWMEKDSPTRRLVLALGVYLATTLVMAVVAGPDRMAQHTPFNHYAHLADAWLHGRQDLANGAPAYAQGNDFAVFGGKTYISFPPFPAVLMLPFVALAGSPENFRDGQFIVWLSGVGPALLFLAFEWLRQAKRSPRSEGENVALALLFSFGTVYFFTAVQGTVWFAAHVVGVGLLAGFAWASLGARRPLVAGLLMACAWMTRPTMLFTSVFFAFEALRASIPEKEEGACGLAVLDWWRAADKVAWLRRCALFAAPVLVSFGVASWMNHARYGAWSPFAFGHEHLTVVWQNRMLKWGLFGYHYLPKNLGVMLTILPWLPPKGATLAPPFQINEHGLALWFTTPILFWLFRPKVRSATYDALILAALLPLGMNLLYQNSGWRQFGYRFSNDYAPLLFLALAVGARPLGWAFRAAAAWGLVWNLFGAVTFDRAGYDRFYFREGSQTVLYQAD